MAQVERAILAGVSRSGGDGADARLEELARLAESAGAVVAGKLVQRRAAPHSATFLGAGKIEELQQLCYETSADLVILDHELSPAQQRNLERKLNLKVIDRPGIVLDIFARRARTREGRLQVELAQMTYLLPRLTGRGVLLSRLGGGIGTRGPGETKLEVDRRRIRKRITDLRRAISEIGRTRSLQREARREAQLPVVALVGYTNAGKSTLLNALTNAGVFVEDKLFATLDPTVRKVRLPNGRPVLLVDTVGFITNLPVQLVAAFRATLE
ncbi:MAG: GTPase HflX, partial [bacterium]